jgi:hypothetical protein
MTASLSPVQQTYPELELVDFHTALKDVHTSDSAERLLRNIHEGLYNKTFPLPDEQEDIEDWLSRLREPQGDKPHVFISAMGKDLYSNQPEVVGFMVSEYYPRSNSALVNYVIKDEAYCRDNPQGNPYYKSKPLREHQLNLLDEAAKEHGKALRAVFSESNDPAKIHWSSDDPTRFERDVMSPEYRLKLFEGRVPGKEGWGMKQINLNYIQPPLSDGQEACHDLILASLPNLHGEHATAQDTHAFLNDFWESFAGHSPSEHSTAGKKMMQQADEMVRGERELFHSSKQILGEGVQLLGVLGQTTGRSRI